MLLPSPAPKPSQYRPDIDGLRAIAILAVVFFHAFPERVRGGYIGVDIFFVISGYLITGIILRGLQQGDFSLRSFYGHRVKRIFPALITMMLMVCGFSWFFLLPEEFSQLGWHMLSSVGFVQNIALWKESGYFDTSSDLKPLMHLWSLAVEEQFYLFFPLACMTAWRHDIGLWKVLLMTLLASFSLNVVFVQSHPEATFFLPHSRVWELLAGSILTYGQMACRGELNTLPSSQSIAHQVLSKIGNFCDKPAIRNLLATSGLLLLLTGIFALNKNKAFPGWWAIAPVAGAVMLIAAGPAAWINRNLLASRLMVFIGLISYPLYLWHWPLLSLAHIVGTSAPTTSMSVTLVCAGFLLAWVTYRVVERPIRFGMAGLPKEFALVSSMLALAGIGGWVHANNGVTTRFPDADKLLTQHIDFKWYDYVRTGRCHIQDGDTMRHDPSCYEPGHPSIALWGDSHASSLYPGLHKLQTDQAIAITQLTTNACPPIFGAERANSRARQNCSQVNEIALNNLASHKPDVLLIHSVYQSPHQFTWPTQSVLVSMTATLKEVRSMLPNTQIVLLGPMPRWRESPQKTSFLHWRELLYKGTPIHGPGPIRQQAELLSELDAGLSRIAQDQGVHYISPLGVLCNQEGCISRVGDKPEQFIAIDYGHLSKAGSEFFIEAIKPQLLAFLKQH